MRRPSKPGVSNTRPAGRMWPARTFCAARDVFWKVSYNSTFTLPSALKRCREMIELMLNVTQCGFRRGRSTTDAISLSSKFMRNVGSMPKTSTYALSTLRKHNTGFLAKSLLREYGIEGRLLLADKSLYSCSEICVHVGKVKSRPFTVGVGHWRGFVLSPLYFRVSTT